MGDACPNDNILMHPVYRRRLENAQGRDDYTIQILNYHAIAEAYGSEGVEAARSALMSRLARALGPQGFVSYEGGGRVRITAGGSSYPEPRKYFESWRLFAALVHDIMMEPVETGAGPVHLSADIRPYVSDRPTSAYASNLAAKPLEDLAAREQVRRRYQCDMTALSPVLAAIGGYNLGPGHVIDVDVLWRPVIRAGGDGAPAFFEASLGIVSPSGNVTSAPEAIAASERLGLARLIDEYIANRVADELIEARGTVALAVSVSPQSLANTEFWRDLLLRLEGLGGITSKLIVELREDASLAVARQGIAETLARLRRGGCRISIGNFGAGSTSFRDALVFGPDIISVDRHFTSSGLRNRLGNTLTAHLIGMSFELADDVVIDGIDTDEIATASLGLGATLLKGDWYGRPRIVRPWAPRTDKFEIYGPPSSQNCRAGAIT